MMSDVGKLPSLGAEETAENGVPGGEEEHSACGGVAEGDGPMRGSLGYPSVDKALVQHLIHCECLLQVSMWDIVEGLGTGSLDYDYVTR